MIKLTINLNNILVTGASGFIGINLLRYLINKNLNISTLSRKDINITGVKSYKVTSYNDPKIKWSEILNECSVIIHLSGIAHQRDNVDNIFINYVNKINVENTVFLAKQAIKNKVKRFIFLSSISVCGQSGSLSLKKSDKPVGVYAKTKLKAEEELIKLAKMSDLQLVIIRPPLVYGNNGPGNYEKLVKLINLRIPLPFKNFDNKKQFISIYNLVDLIYKSITFKKLKIHKILAADKNKISTEKFIRLIAENQKKNVTMFYLNKNFLTLIAKIFNKESDLDKLSNNLEIDISHVKKILNWTPPYSIYESFQKMKKMED